MSRETEGVVKAKRNTFSEVVRAEELKKKAQKERTEIECVDTLRRICEEAQDVPDNEFVELSPKESSVVKFCIDRMDREPFVFLFGAGFVLLVVWLGLYLFYIPTHPNSVLWVNFLGMGELLNDMRKKEGTPDMVYATIAYAAACLLLFSIGCVLNLWFSSYYGQKVSYKKYAIKEHEGLLFIKREGVLRLLKRFEIDFKKP